MCCSDVPVWKAFGENESGIVICELVVAPTIVLDMAESHHIHIESQIRVKQLPTEKKSNNSIEAFDARILQCLGQHEVINVLENGSVRLWLGDLQRPLRLVPAIWCIH